MFSASLRVGTMTLQADLTVRCGPVQKGRFEVRVAPVLASRGFAAGFPGSSSSLSIERVCATSVIRPSISCASGQ